MSLLFPYLLPLNHHTVVHHAPVVVPDTLHLFATHHTPTFVSYNTEPHFTVHFSTAATESAETESAAAAPKSAVEETPAAAAATEEPAPEAPAPAPASEASAPATQLKVCHVCHCGYSLCHCRFCTEARSEPAPKNTVVKEIVYLNMNLW
jgi:hypothetical protein